MIIAMVIITVAFVVHNNEGKNPWSTPIERNRIF